MYLWARPGEACQVHITSNQYLDSWELGTVTAHSLDGPGASERREREREREREKESKVWTELNLIK